MEKNLWIFVEVFHHTKQKERGTQNEKNARSFLQFYGELMCGKFRSFSAECSEFYVCQFCNFSTAMTIAMMIKCHQLMIYNSMIRITRSLAREQHLWDRLFGDKCDVHNLAFLDMPFVLLYTWLSALSHKDISQDIRAESGGSRRFIWRSIAAHLRRFIVWSRTFCCWNLLCFGREKMLFVRNENEDAFSQCLLALKRLKGDPISQTTD